MNNRMKVAGVVATLLLILLFVYASLFAWHHPIGNLTPCETPTIIFSEFKEEDNSGIYTTEILEYETGDCSNSWRDVYLYLLDAEGYTHYEDTGILIANYEGGNPRNINITSKITNDNGTNYPIRIINNMSGAPYEYYNYNANSTYGTDFMVKMSVGDKIMVYGSGSDADGPAREGWSLRIKWGITGDTVGEMKIS